MYICICTYIHTYIHAYTHTYIHTYIHTHTHIYIYSKKTSAFAILSKRWGRQAGVTFTHRHTQGNMCVRSVQVLFAM